MNNSEELILYFGSRAGSFFALALFGILFAVLGLAVSYECRRRNFGRPTRFGRVLGFLLFAGPVSLIYVTSLSGFYELHATADEVRLHYLVPAMTTTIPAAALKRVDARPAFKLRWRLYLEADSGRWYKSATWHREETQDAESLINARLHR